MNDEEFVIFQKLRNRSTEKTNSNYLRKLALREPVIVRYRNQSIDDLTTAIISLKKELNFIGHNLNQAVHKLHTLDKIPEFRNWLHTYDQLRKDLTSQTTNTLTQVHQLISQWSQD